MGKLRSALREMWHEVGGEVDADSPSWRTFIGATGLIKESSRQGRDETITRLQEWLIFDPTDLSETRWGYMDEVLQNEENRQLTLKLRLAATTRSALTSDLKKRELAMAERVRKSGRESRGIS